jgi:hypothetical protein
VLLLQGAEPEQVAEELMGARAAVGERLEGAKVRACCYISDQQYMYNIYSDFKSSVPWRVSRLLWTSVWRAKVRRSAVGHELCLGMSVMAACQTRLCLFVLPGGTE